MNPQNKTAKDLKALYDGDGLVYNAGFSADSQFRKQLLENYSGITETEIEEAMATEDYTSHALQVVKLKLLYATERFNEEYKLYLQEGPTFRYDVATIQPYKGNRKDARRPKYYDEIREYMFNVWKAIPVKIIETDDAIGIEQFDNSDKYTVIITQDKDLKTIPGWHFDPVKEELFYQTMRDANNFFWWQMMVGDVADHISGVKGIGAKRATAVIEDCNHDTDLIRDRVQALYAKQYGPEWQAAYTENGTLLYILRKYEHLHTGCPLLWK